MRTISRSTSPSLSAIISWWRAHRGSAGLTRGLIGAEILSPAVVCELQGHAEVAPLQERDDGLKVVAVLARNADLVALDGRLDLDLRFLDRLDDLPGFLRRNPLLHLHGLPHGGSRGRLDLAELERLDGHTALD